MLQNFTAKASALILLLGIFSVPVVSMSHLSFSMSVTIDDERQARYKSKSKSKKVTWRNDNNYQCHGQHELIMSTGEVPLSQHEKTIQVIERSKARQYSIGYHNI